MNPRTKAALLLLIGALCLLQASCDQQKPAPQPQANEGPEKVCYGIYSTLATGGTLYAGVVASVTVTRVDQRYEWGTLQFRVERTVVGMPRKEMTVFWWADGGPHMWDGWETAPWEERPRRGQRLLLLLRNTNRKGFRERYGKHNMVAGWLEVDPNDPLVLALADAGNYLTAKDEPTRRDLFRRMCQSKFRNLRSFARCAAFVYVDPVSGDGIGSASYDPVRQSRRVLDYLKYAVPHFANNEERREVTFNFRTWLGSGKSGITEEARAAFEDWYRTELACRDDPDVQSHALGELNQLIVELGKTKTLALFKKAGRAGLIRQVRDCTRSDKDYVSERAQKLLARLEKK